MEDFKEIRGVLVALAIRLKGDVGFFYGLPFLEAVEIMKEVAKVGKGK